MLLERARTAWSDWRARNAGFFLAKHGPSGSRRPGAINLPSGSIKLLSFNVQAGIGSQHFRDYVTGSWKHVVAHRSSVDNIEQIAGIIGDYDVVALQEVDGGSLRSKNLNQIVHLAYVARFAFWHQQLNRNLGRFGQFSNGLLSHFEPYHIEDHRLPGLPGRGAIIAKYGHPDEPLVIVGVHLALGEKHRNQQLAYLHEQLKNDRHIAVMGDFNCLPENLHDTPFAELSLTTGASALHSYPSWQPDRCIDHILVSPSLSVTRAEVLMDCRLSDHLPVATHIQLPEAVLEAASHAPLTLPR